MTLLNKTSSPTSPTSPSNLTEARGKVLWQRLQKLDPLRVLSILILVLVAAAAIVPQLVAPQDPYAVDLSVRLMAPSWDHPFGTDVFGRDVYSRVIYGARLSLMVGIGAVLIGGIIGGIMGVTAGYFGGITKTVLMRISDILLAFPGLLLALALISILGPSLINLMIAVAISDVPGYARVIRGRVLSVKARTFVQGAQVIGASTPRILVRHILPNAFSSLVVLGSANMGIAIVVGASLSFLGFGPQAPTAEWGAMLSEGRNLIGTAWWVATFPGIALVLLVLAINIWGDWLRDLLDPKLAFEG